MDHDNDGAIVKLGPAFLPVPLDGPVLEVGSGGRPHPRATVLVDRFLSGEHREGRQLVRDGRPLVIADACALPFRTGAFSYSMAVHVLEHVDQAPIMLAELQRVSQAGYIETPSSLHDFLFAADPYPDIHLWWVDVIGDGDRSGPRLRLQRKNTAMARQPFGEFLQNLRQTDPYLEAWMERRPKLFTTQYHWKGSIAFEVVPEEAAPVSPPFLVSNDERWSRRGYYWGMGLWGWKRWAYAWFLHPKWRKWALGLLGYRRSKP
jgi:hypothetical protein